MVTTADRVLGLLSLFSADRWRWTVEEAAEELGVPTSTAYRYFKSLAQAELLSSHVAGHYMLGPAICALDRQMRLHDPFINASRDEMKHLADEYPDTIILLTRLYKNTVMCVHREGQVLAAQGYERGRPMPLDRGAASKVILAYLPAKQVRSFAHSGTVETAPFDEAGMRDELKRIKAQGYAITRGRSIGRRWEFRYRVWDNNSLEGSLSFVLNASHKCDEQKKIIALIRARKSIEANLLLSELEPPNASFIAVK